MQACIDRDPPPRGRTRLFVALGLLAAALFPVVDAARARRLPPGSAASVVALPLGDHARRLGPLLASWQTVGGCGAGATTGSAVGIKWIGRGVSGGLFNVQCQSNYSRLTTDPRHTEQHLFFSSLVTRDEQKWSFGVNVPFVYKYLDNPYDTGVDLSNGGLGDLGLLVTRRMGAINATSLTATLGLPTGVYDARYKMRLLSEHQQTGFGRLTGSLMLDHTIDETWGLMVVGALGAWRGGENAVSNYRAPVGSAYWYTGWFLGPLVPAIGLSATGAPGHDRDQTETEYTALFSAAANLSLEWSTDWVAVLVGASLPYQYDGVTRDNDGRPRSAWGPGPWMVGLGVSFAPF